MRVVEQSFRKKSYLCHFFDHGLLESLRIGIACYSYVKSNSACLSLFLMCALPALIVPAKWAT